MAMEAPRTSRIPIPSALLLSVLVVMSISVHPSCAVTELVDKVCKQTSNYTFCRDVLNADPRTRNPESDLVILAYAAFKSAYDTAINTRDYIGSLLNSTDGPILLQKSLRRCQADYKRAAEKLLEGYDCLDSETYDIIDELADEAARKVNDCQTGLDGTAPPPALTEKNRVQKDLCQIGAVIGRLINNPGAAF